MFTVDRDGRVAPFWSCEQRDASKPLSVPREEILALRALVAEDSAILQQSISDLLRSADVPTVIRAMDGTEAVRLALESQPDVVILDYDMPGMNGIDAARAIRGRWPQMPVILISVLSSEYLIATALSVGIAGYILKRDIGDDLIRAIETVRCGSTFVSPGAARSLYERYLPAARLA
jgi:two-component system, NarL family, response regulator NreC